MQPRLFNPIYNDQAYEFKEYLPVNINLRFETVASHLALCEEKYIVPIIGQELFDRIAAYYDEHPTLPDDCPDKTLIEKVRFALVRIAIWKGYDVISTNISDTGVSSEVDKENRLFRYQEENVKNTLKNEGFDYLDNILQYLEHNDTSFPEYAIPTATALVKDTATFNDCYNINNSRLVFLKMRQYIRDVELIKLQHRIGTALYNAMLTADESLPKYAAILPNIRRFVVYESVAEGIGELHKMPTEKGLVFESSSMDGISVKPVEDSKLMETRAQFSHKANQYLAAAINHIRLNKSDYPDYADFAGDSPADGVMHFDNSNSKFFLT